MAGDGLQFPSAINCKMSRLSQIPKRENIAGHCTSAQQLVVRVFSFVSLQRLVSAWLALAATVNHELWYLTLMFITTGRSQSQCLFLLVFWQLHAKD